MKKSHGAIAALIVLLLTLVSVALQAQGQTSEEREAARRRQNAQAFENNATVITLYARDGKTVATVGERALYGDAVLSPDGTRLAVIKNDLDVESSDLWIVDVATGKNIRMTQVEKREFVGTPVWSPDGAQIVYTAIRKGTEGVYRRVSNGQGPEELVYANPGAGLDLSDWSRDGRFLTFTKSDLTGGVLYVLPLAGSGERKPIEIFRSEKQLFGPRFSPDGRYISYLVSQPGRNEIYVRPFDPSNAAAPAAPSQVTDASRGRVYWRRDGKALMYSGLDLTVMVRDVNTSGRFEFSKPRVLFRSPTAVPLFISAISSDGDRFAAMPPPRGPQLQQITVYDRGGKVVSKVGEPGLFAQPAFSPDGNRLVVVKQDLETRSPNFWIFDIATGKGTAITKDLQPKNTPMWSPDGRYILYVSFRDSYAGVYRIASSGTGSEELLFRYTPGAGLNLTDISPDGKYLICGSGGVLLVVPLTGTDPLARQAIEFSREEFDVTVGRLSPDGRFMAYRSNEADPDRGEVFVRRFNPQTGTAEGESKWQVSKDGVAAMLHWRNDGKEFFFRARNEPGTNDLSVMSAEVSTTPAFTSGPPKLLFKLAGPMNGNLGNISRDGQRFVFAINVPASAK